MDEAAALITLDFRNRLETAVGLATDGNQSELARRLGVSRSAVNQWLSGQTEPTAANAVLLARLAGVRPEWLILGEEPKLAPKVDPNLLMKLLNLLSDAKEAEVAQIIDFAEYRKTRDSA